MTRNTYTVEMRSGPVQDLDAQLLERFSDLVLADKRVVGAVPSADLAMSVIELRATVLASVKAMNPIAALEIASQVFIHAAARAKLRMLDGIVDASVWIDDDSDHDRRELLSGADIAERLGITRQRIAQLVAEKGRFPRPAATFGTVSVWYWGDIADWIRAGGRGEAHRQDAASAALEIILSGDDDDRRQQLFRRLIALANGGDESAKGFLEANPDRAFFDGRQWVEQVDSGRGPGIAVGGTRVVRTRR